MKQSGTTRELPTDIPIIEGQSNLYTAESIRGAGYHFEGKAKEFIGEAPDILVVWSKEDKMLVFIEYPSGLYVFGGYLEKKEKADEQ